MQLSVQKHRLRGWVKLAMQILMLSNHCLESHCHAVASHAVHAFRHGAMLTGSLPSLWQSTCCVHPLLVASVMSFSSSHNCCGKT